MFTTYMVTGASGFLGEHLMRRLAAHAPGQVLGLTHTHPVEIEGTKTARLDLRDKAAVTALLMTVQPRVIFHCAALTDVAACQQAPHEASDVIVRATMNLVDAIAEQTPATRLLHVSTDLVFDGLHAPYRPEAEALPLSVYGRLKRQAEIRAEMYRYALIVRCALLYGAATTHKQGCLGWMLQTLRAGQRLPLFVDEYRTPVFVGDVCTALLILADQPLSTGLPRYWHAGGPQRLSRFEMGQQVCAAFRLPTDLLQPLPLAASTYLAPRPEDVSLDSKALWECLGWRPLPLATALTHLAAHQSQER